MALSGVSQSHVQPVWAEIPSRSADIRAQAVPRTRPLAEDMTKYLFEIICSFTWDPSNLTTLPAQNLLLADPVNSGVPFPDIQLEMGIFCSAACIANGL